MKEAQQPKKCPACGKELPAKRRSHRKYCNAVCRMQVYRLGVKIEAAKREREARPAKVDVVETVIALGQQVRCRCCGNRFTFELVPTEMLNQVIDYHRADTQHRSQQQNRPVAETPPLPRYAIQPPTQSTAAAPSTAFSPHRPSVQPTAQSTAAAQSTPVSAPQPSMPTAAPSTAAAHPSVSVAALSTSSRQSAAQPGPSVAMGATSRPMTPNRSPDVPPRISEVPPSAPVGTPSVRQSAPVIAGPSPQPGYPADRSSSPTSATPASSAHTGSQLTKDFQPSEKHESKESAAGEEQQRVDPTHDHHADLDELFGPSDPYYDPIAKHCAQTLRLKHNVACLQRQRGEVETERPIDTSLTLYEQTHRVATLIRALRLKRMEGLAQPPTLDWSHRLDDSSEQKLMDTLQKSIQALQQKVKDLKEDRSPPVRQSAPVVESPSPQTGYPADRLSAPTSATPATSAHSEGQLTFDSEPSAADGSQEESAGEEPQRIDPTHDHRADLDELFGPSDPYYDPAAKHCARVLRLKHNVACLQRQRGEVETEPLIDTNQTLYEQTHRLATLTREISIQRMEGLAQPPTLDWSDRLDDSSEQQLMDNLENKIQALRQKVKELKEDSSPPVRQSAPEVASPSPQSGSPSERLSPRTSATPASSAQTRSQLTMDFQSSTEAEYESKESADGEEQQRIDPRHDHHADLDELFGPSDPYYDPAAKHCARVLRLKHNVACLQRQRGEVETERLIDTNQTLYEQTHRLATLTREISIQRMGGLAQPPTLDWSDRLDDSSEQQLMDNLDNKIQALRQKVKELKEE